MINKNYKFFIIKMKYRIHKLYMINNKVKIILKMNKKFKNKKYK